MHASLNWRVRQRRKRQDESVRVREFRRISALDSGFPGEA